MKLILMEHMAMLTQSKSPNLRLWTPLLWSDAGSANTVSTTKSSEISGVILILDAGKSKMKDFAIWENGKEVLIDG